MPVYSLAREIEALQQCASLSLICRACGYHTEHQAPTYGDILVLLEVKLKDQSVPHCPTCGHTASELPEGFIEERLRILRQHQVEEAQKLRERNYPLWIDLYCQSDLSAYVNDANDHNPLVLIDCERCLGEGCSVCEGTGVKLGSTPRPFFGNTRDYMDAIVDEQGWVTCPGCNKRFNVNQPLNWTGRRHSARGRCGQKIRLLNL